METNEAKIIKQCQEGDLEAFGILYDEYIKKIFGFDVTHKKDPSQRSACGCVASRDIGMYDSCLFGCIYCYATTNIDRAKERYREHKATSPSLIGWHEAKPKLQSTR